MFCPSSTRQIVSELLILGEFQARACEGKHQNERGRGGATGRRRAMTCDHAPPAKPSAAELHAAREVTKERSRFSFNCVLGRGCVLLRDPWLQHTEVEALTDSFWSRCAKARSSPASPALQCLCRLCPPAFYSGRKRSAFAADNKTQR